MTETLVGQFPKHIGSTGGLLNSAETEEKYAIVWKSSKEQAFELPTGGAAIMHEGDNLMYFARKEQCLALGTQLRAFKPRIEDFKIYRIFPGGDIEFLHPKDGVFSEKVNEGREKVGHNPRRIGENPNPAGLGFSPILLGLCPTFSLPSFTFSEKTPSFGCKNSISPPGKIR